MTWADPLTAGWKAGLMVTAALLNAHVRDNLLVLSTHAHGGSGGDGNSDLTGLDKLTFDDKAANPSTTRKLQWNGTSLLWGAGNFNITNEDPVAATAGLRSVGQGVGADDAAAGDHTH